MCHWGAAEVHLSFNLFALIPVASALPLSLLSLALSPSLSARCFVTLEIKRTTMNDKKMNANKPIYVPHDAKRFQHDFFFFAGVRARPGSATPSDTLTLTLVANTHFRSTTHVVRINTLSESLRICLHLSIYPLVRLWLFLLLLAYAPLAMAKSILQTFWRICISTLPTHMFCYIIRRTAICRGIFTSANALGYR